MRTNWSVPGVGDFSIKSIPSMIPSTDEHKLYEGVMFKNKDELKTTLGKYVLKQKFEYRITRSSQTYFLASCKDKTCTFKLRVGSVQEGAKLKLARLNYVWVRFKRVVIGRLLNLLRIIVVSWSCSATVHGRCQQKLFRL